MAKDPIVDEIRKNRNEIAKESGNSLKAIAAEAKKRQKGRGKKVVSRTRTKQKRSI